MIKINIKNIVLTITNIFLIALFAMTYLTGESVISKASTQNQNNTQYVNIMKDNLNNQRENLLSKIEKTREERVRIYEDSQKKLNNEFSETMLMRQIEELSVKNKLDINSITFSSERTSPSLMAREKEMTIKINGNEDDLISLINQIEEKQKKTDFAMSTIENINLSRVKNNTDKELEYLRNIGIGGDDKLIKKSSMEIVIKTYAKNK